INSLNSTVSDLATGKSGTIQQADKNGDINIGKDSGGTKVNMANNTGASRTVTGVSAGAVSSTSSDAINGSQLYQANTSIANVLGGNAKVATDGTISTSNIGGTGQSTVDGAVSNLNGRVGNLESAFNQTHQELSKFRNETNAGIAGAMAIASLGQPIEKGASAISLGTGNWNNSTSIALGASIISEDHQIMGAPVNYIWKAAGTSNFRGESGGGASVTVTWR
ncbi:YadA-like family protein, partial [Acinetobacter sp. FNA3]|nr:YadA-like family protein [Acinetobacter pollinis]MBF7701835.1 YadA-like family protein [Acinetobacter pollinis]